MEGTDVLYKGTSGTLFDYDLVINDLSNDFYYMAIVTLAEGKTLADLQALPEAETEPPPFVNVLIVNFVHGGDVSHNKLNITQGPLYIVCFVESQGVATRTAELGPIEVR